MPAWPLLIEPLSRLIDKIIPDAQAAAKAKAELLREGREQDLRELELALQAAAQQNSINQVEAGNTQLFVSGWRPFIGWVCGVAFAYHFVCQPFLAFLMAVSGEVVDLPYFDMETLSTVLMGMLGLGGLRTLEKIRGSA